jgi:Cys-Gly metallodipeptidase DUG1
VHVYTGAEIKLCRPVEDKNPVVIGRLGRREECPTVTFYGHYDVQPAMEREWGSDPFEVQSRDGYFFGRGTSDNKVRS